MQQLQPFRRYLDIQLGHAGDIAARPIKAGYELELHRIADGSEDNRNSGGRRLCRKRRRSGGCGNCRHLTMHERPPSMAADHYDLPPNAAPAQSYMPHLAWPLAGRAAASDAGYWVYQKGDELAPPHCWPRVWEGSASYQLKVALWKGPAAEAYNVRFGSKADMCSA